MNKLSEVIKVLKIERFGKLMAQLRICFINRVIVVKILFDLSF